MINLFGKQREPADLKDFIIVSLACFITLYVFLHIEIVGSVIAGLVLGYGIINKVNQKMEEKQ